MKKFLTFMLSICLFVPCCLIFTACVDDDPKMEIWDGTILEVSTAVDGVVKIETAEELAGFAKEVNLGNTFEGLIIKLVCDMDLANKEWKPIGYGSSNFVGTMLSEEGALFKGVFDGQNHTISNLRITQFEKGGLTEDASCGVGLFGNIFQAEIKNLKIENAKLKANQRVGALVGYSIDSNIVNCHVEDAEVNCIYNNSEESGDKAGALVGYFAKGIYGTSAASIINCSAEESVVKADRDAGQVIGCVWNEAVYTNITAEEVIVSCNSSSSNVPGYTKSGQYITNDIVGRLPQ